MKGFLRAVKYIAVGILLTVVFLFYLNPPEPVREMFRIKDRDKRVRHVDTPKVGFSDAILVAGKRFFGLKQANKHQLVNGTIPPDQLQPDANNPVPPQAEPLNNAQPFDNNGITDPLAQQPNGDATIDVPNDVPLQAQFPGSKGGPASQVANQNFNQSPQGINNNQTLNNLGTKARDIAGTIINEATEKILQEGHWIGLEVVPLTPQLAAANNIPADVTGVLVDEVTLTAAAAGVMAGDVIFAVNGLKVKDLNTFEKSTRQVATINQASIAVYRGGNNKEVKVVANNALGVAQMEGAPMILSTAVRPHGYYGPCDRCHVISKTPSNKTGQLAKDAGDVLIITPPPIVWGAQAPHGDRGRCTNCHTIK
uniref:Magnetosome protein MamP n=1 Tax=uncultured Nitrospirota bacterium TaxID=170969 RepID=A0A142BU47_9BACT|nr:magnetosome protein MamP [uncultured Nitrospirota bacterium]